MESTIACQLQSILIGSRLDTDIHANTCRLAFYGHVLDGFTDPDYATKELPTKLRIYKRKEKIGSIDRIVDGQTLIGKDLFQKETNINAFVNFKVELDPTGERGFIESPFGQSGKFKVRFMSKTNESQRTSGCSSVVLDGLSDETKQAFSGNKSKKQAASKTTTDEPTESDTPQRIRIVLKFKKYLFQEKTVITQ